MKTLLIALATGSLMLAACSSSKPEEAAAPRITVEEAMTQCQQASGENADRAVFDACMKTKAINVPLNQLPLSLLHLSL